MLIFEINHRFYSVEVSLSLVAHLTSSDPQEFATDPCSIHGGTIPFVNPIVILLHLNSMVSVYRFVSDGSEHQWTVEEYLFVQVRARARSKYVYVMPIPLFRPLWHIV